MKLSFECRHCGARVVAHQVSEAPPSQCPMCKGPLRQLVAAARQRGEQGEDSQPMRARFVLNDRKVS